MKKGTLYIISAPSGAGKSTLLNAYFAKMASDHSCAFSISHTTRAKRQGEKNGEHYYFIDEAQFLAMIEKQDFIEYARVFDHYYGTSKSAIEKQLHQGKTLFLDIDWQGARQVRAQMKDAVSIFILPPSLEILESRLRHRASDDENTIQKRMSQARDQVSHFKEYDYCIMNDQLETAVAELSAIILAESLKTPQIKSPFDDL